jgi:hypothetical protein
MNCEEASPLLSAYYDGELPRDQREAIAEHVAHCFVCSEQLAALRRLTTLAQQSPAAEPPRDLTERVLRAVGGERMEIAGRQRTARRHLALAGGLAAVAVVLGLGVWQFWPHDDHDHFAMVEAFDEFLNDFAQNKGEATNVLVKRFGGKPIDAAAAARVLKRPTLTPDVIQEHQVASRHVVKMPCCDCVQTVYSRSGKSSLVVFEHEKEQRDWFGMRPCIRAQCSQRNCCLIQLSSGLAASWQANNHYVTVIGVRDISELEMLIDALKPS